VSEVPAAVWLWVPLLASGLFGALGPALAGRLAPRPATWLLSVGSLLVAASGVTALALVVVTVGAELPEFARIGHWSARRLEAGQPVDRGAAIGAAALLSVQLALLATTGWRRGRALMAAWVSCRGTPSTLVVLPDPNPTAFAVPGWPGRIVASAGLLRALSPAERRAVLAHEQAHLDGRHDLHLTGAALAAAVNPLLARVPAAIRLATERWSDEVAAAVTGDRRLVADTIGRAAIGRASTGRASIGRAAIGRASTGRASTGSGGLAEGAIFTMGAARNDVARRISALHGGPPRQRPLLAAALIALAVVAVGATAVAMQDTRHLFEAAERAYAAAAGATH
jgi:Zn-dependent protease with chaperone function